MDLCITINCHSEQAPSTWGVSEESLDFTHIKFDVAQDAIFFKYN